MATDKVQTGLRLQESVLEKITAIAKQEHRSLNAQIEYIIQKYIKDYEIENGEITFKADKN